MEYKIEIGYVDSRPVADILDYLARKQGICAKIKSERPFGDGGQLVQIVTMAVLKPEVLAAINSNKVSGKNRIGNDYDFGSAKIIAVEGE
jgi:hypothetical protein